MKLKAPQLRLLFLLLTITLFGAIFGWRAAIDQKKRLDLDSQKGTREQQLEGWEKSIRRAAEYEPRISDQSDEGKELRRKSRERQLEEIAKERERLRNLKP
jgi:hypothetical protein